MLIVSQKFGSIVNFQRIREISIFTPFENDTLVWIYADTTFLGEYKDIERAQSILKNLLNIYNDCNAFGSGFIKNDIYYMPEV